MRQSTILALGLTPFVLAASSGRAVAAGAEPIKPEAVAATAKTYGYAVVISKATSADPAWRAVADALAKKYTGQIVVYEGDVKQAKADLSRLMPKYTAFVAKPEEIGRGFVADVHRMTRQLDADWFTDTIWGIVTGLSADDAMAIVTQPGDLTISTAVTTTGVNDGFLNEVFTVSDGRRGTYMHKATDGKRSETHADGDDAKKDRSALFHQRFSEIKPDAIVTSAHGFENGIEMPWGAGMFVARKGELFTMTLPDKTLTKIEPQTNPKVFLPIGNCLVGNIDKKHTDDSIILALQRSAAVRQTVAYTVETWFGRGGWGTLGMFQTTPGMYNVAESWYFNHQMMLMEIREKYQTIEKFEPDWATLTFKTFFDAAKAAGLDEKSKEMMGLAFDRDVVAFYGDPAWDARLDRSKAPGSPTVSLTRDGNEYTLIIQANDPESFQKMSTPVCVMMPNRVKHQLTKMGFGYNMIYADNFVVVRNPNKDKGSTKCFIRFTADAID